MLTSSKVRSQSNRLDTLTRWSSLQSGQHYWFLIFDRVSSSRNKWKSFSSAQDWQSSALQRSTDLVLITHNSMWLGHSCPASTVPQQMLPCCGCHPGQDRVTQNRVQRAQSTAGMAQREGGDPIDCVCRSTLQNITYQYQFQLGLMTGGNYSWISGILSLHYSEWMLDVIWTYIPLLPESYTVWIDDQHSRGWGQKRKKI